MTEASDKNYNAEITIIEGSAIDMKKTKAYYDVEDDAIHVNKNIIDSSGKVASELTLVHEHQHQINAHKSKNADMSLDEYYQRGVHDEITALIAEKLEIRRQYQACKTDEERAAFFKKFENNADNAEYIDAIKSGEINPNSTSKEDFIKEMAFIKDSSIKYRADPTDSSYNDLWTNNTCVYLNQKGDAVKSNPQAFEEEVREMYNIGGFDFNTVGNTDLHVLDNQTVRAADNLLSQGADPEKVARLMQLGDGPYNVAESLDLSGLSREQAEKVLQTAYTVQSQSKFIAEDMAMGVTPRCGDDYNNNREKMALYLDIKSDIWEKNGTLSEQGDEAKFNELMKKAKEIQLDPQGWFDENQKNLNIVKDPSRAEDLAQCKARIKELQGKTVNFDDVVANADQLKLPLDGTTKEEVLAQMAAAEASKNYVPDKETEAKPVQKDVATRKVDIMDLNTNILKDEFDKRQGNDPRQTEQARDKSEVAAQMKTDKQKQAIIIQNLDSNFMGHQLTGAHNIEMQATTALHNIMKTDSSNAMNIVQHLSETLLKHPQNIAVATQQNDNNKTFNPALWQMHRGNSGYS